MCERTLGVGHPNTIIVRGNYENCVKKLTASQNSFSAKRFFQQIQAIIDRLKPRM
jgi:hypothetical protein